MKGWIYPILQSSFYGNREDVLSVSEVEGMLNDDMSSQDSDVKPKDPRKRHRILIDDDDDDEDEDKENSGSRFAASTQKPSSLRSSKYRPKRLSMGPTVMTNSSSTLDSLTEDDDELPQICFSQKE